MLQTEKLLGKQLLDERLIVCFEAQMSRSGCLSLKSGVNTTHQSVPPDKDRRRIGAKIDQLGQLSPDLTIISGSGEKQWIGETVALGKDSQLLQITRRLSCILKGQTNHFKSAPGVLLIILLEQR